MFSDSMMLGGGRQAAFSIARSVRLDGAADYFTRTPTVLGNRKTWTFSTWVKRAKQGLSQPVLRVWDGSSTGDDKYLFIAFNASDKLLVTGYASTWRLSTPVFRDTTGWMHLVVTFDSPTQSIKAYVNGLEITAWDTFTPLAVNQDSAVNAIYPHSMGDPANPWDGYLASPLLVDGAALDPSQFGETDPVTGSWRPKRPSVSDYGPNGFYLNFATPADLGRDVSGNGNHWTPVSLGAADVVADTPTNTYCTLNPLDMAGTPVPTRGNLVVDGAYSTPYNIRSTFAVSTGKWYWEVRTGNGEPLVGILDAEAKINSQNTLTFFPQGYCYSSDGQKQNNGVSSAYGQTWADATIGVALDLGAGTLAFYKDGVAQGVAFTGLSGVFSPCLSRSGLVGTFANCTVNFGQFPFTHTPPAGFKALCTATISAPTVPSPARHMDVVTYTGTGAARAIGGLGFQPDLVWIKARDQAASSMVFDSLRGPNQSLYSGNAVIEQTEANGLTAFTSDGFDLGNGSVTNGACNADQMRYVAWCWKAGDTVTANTDGQVPSQVSVNQAAGFSIVTFSGQGSEATVGHGLGTKPAFVIIRCRNNVGTYGWNVWHQNLTGPTHYLDLSTYPGESTGASNFSGEWTESHFKLGQTMMSSGANLVAYCWAEVPGYSKFGIYTGNGDANGPFVHCGFRPRFVLIKRIDVHSSSNSWRIWDSERSVANPGNAVVHTDGAWPEDTSLDTFDILSNGFKIRNGVVYGGSNGAGTDTVPSRYIFAAFAESPLGGTRTVPAKGR